MENKTAKEIASTLPCACGNCGMYEDKAAEKIKEFASQELTEYKTKLKEQLRTEYDSRDLLSPQNVIELIDSL